MDLMATGGKSVSSGLVLPLPISKHVILGRFLTSWSSDFLM